MDRSCAQVMQWLLEESDNDTEIGTSQKLDDTVDSDAEQSYNSDHDSECEQSAGDE